MQDEHRADRQRSETETLRERLGEGSRTETRTSGFRNSSRRISLG